MTQIDTKLQGPSIYKISYNVTDETYNKLQVINKLIDKVADENVNIYDAFSSATIEGARTTLEDVGIALKNGCQTKSEYMVVDTLRATEKAFRHTGDIDLLSLKSIWDTVTENVCDNIPVAGVTYRSGQVYVGSHIPCVSRDIPVYMNMLYKYLNDHNTILSSIIVHFYFVYIHPFCDGNGRTARILNRLCLNKVNTKFKSVDISTPILNNLQRYYMTLSMSEVDRNSELYITPFVEYMVDMILKAVKACSHS